MTAVLEVCKLIQYFNWEKLDTKYNSSKFQGLKVNLVRRATKPVCRLIANLSQLPACERSRFMTQ